MYGKRWRRTVKVRSKATLPAFPSAEDIEAIHNRAYSPNKELHRCGACEAVAMTRAVTILQHIVASMAATDARSLNAFWVKVVVRCRKVGRTDSNDNYEISSGDRGQGTGRNQGALCFVAQCLGQTIAIASRWVAA